MSFTENFRSLPIAALLLSGTQMNVSKTDDTRYRRHLLKANPLTLYIKTSYFWSRIQLARFTIAEAAWSDWLSMMPTNRISSHYPAHVFSDQPIPRIDTIGDNGREPSDYQRVADRYQAEYLRNVTLFCSVKCRIFNHSGCFYGLHDEPDRRQHHRQAGRKPGLGDSTILNPETDDYQFMGDVERNIFCDGIFIRTLFFFIGIIGWIHQFNFLNMRSCQLMQREHAASSPIKIPFVDRLYQRYYRHFIVRCFITSGRSVK